MACPYEEHRPAAEAASTPWRQKKDRMPGNEHRVVRLCSPQVVRLRSPQDHPGQAPQAQMAEARAQLRAGQNFLTAQRVEEVCGGGAQSSGGWSVVSGEK